MANNYSIFEAHLTDAYGDLFANDPDYSYVAKKQTPESLASKMTAELSKGNANLDGEGIKRACKAVKIKKTRKSIMEFLNKQ
jgi:hypothetical protein